MKNPRVAKIVRCVLEVERHPDDSVWCRMTFINKNDQSVSLFRHAIAPPEGSFGYDLFDFSSLPQIPFRIPPRDASRLTDDDFFWLHPWEEYHSDWISLTGAYDLSMAREQGKSFRYRAIHNVSWPDTEAVLVVSAWQALPAPAVPERDPRQRGQ